MISSDAGMSVVFALVILLLGFYFSRVGSTILLAMFKRNNFVSARHVRFLKLFRYLVFIIAIVLALYMLQGQRLGDFEVVTAFVSNAIAVLPSVLTILLVIVLGIIVINFITIGIKWLFDRIGITEYMFEQKKIHILNGAISVVRFGLYVFTALFLLDIFGVDVSGITTGLTFVLYGLGVLLLLYVFMGTRSLIENIISGYYIKASQSFSLGQKIKVDDTTGTIVDISNQRVQIKADNGFVVSIPNAQLISKEVHYKSIATDLDTLEKIKSYFVEQKPSYCGPASITMVLRIFGFTTNQVEVGNMAGAEVGKGTKPDALVHAVHTITGRKVTGAWVDVDHIGDLKQEIRLWLHEGALVIVDYEKKKLFPEAKKAHYSVVVAVEGDELVVLDPSGKKGGVYLADVDKIYAGMDTFSQFLQAKRGYMVFAPEGTTAHHRIEKGLIYSDISFYDDISNTLKKELIRLTEKSYLIESVLPVRVKNFVKKWRERERIARLWKPNTTN